MGNRPAKRSHSVGLSSQVLNYSTKKENRVSLRSARFVPLRVVIQKGSRAAELYKKAEGLHPDALAPGLTPSPEQDLKFRGGKTIQDLNFINFYVAGQSAWDANEI